MTTMDLRSEYEVNVEEAILLLSDPEVLEYLQEHVHEIDRKLIGPRVEGRMRHWEVAIWIRELIPSFARALATGESIGWNQSFHLDLDKLTMTIDVHHSFSQTLMKSTGSGRIIPLGGNRTAVEFHMEFDSSVPVIGRKLEELLRQRVSHVLTRDAEERIKMIRERRAEGRRIGSGKTF